MKIQIKNTQLSKQGFVVRLKSTSENLSLRTYVRLRSESGQGVAEYIIILAVIVIACIALAIAFKGQLTSLWNFVTDQLGTATS